jgi:serine/threonine protein kinase
MRPSLAASAEFHLRFLREARLAAAIDHQHIVTVYQVGEDRGVPLLAMQLLHGQTLEARLKQAGGRLLLPEVLRVGREIAEGLVAAHARGLIHRDIKPANVWLEEGRGRIRIVGFGLARGSEPDASGNGDRFGTPPYTTGRPQHLSQRFPKKEISSPRRLENSSLLVGAANVVVRSTSFALRNKPKVGPLDHRRCVLQRESACATYDE